MDRIRDIIRATEEVVWDIVAFIPLVLVAIILLLVGWLAARLIKRLIIKFLRKLRMEEAAERMGIDSFLLQGGVRYTSVTLVAEIFYWFLIFAVILLALNVLGMSEAGLMFTRVMFYVPKVLIAIVILIFGSLIARFIQAITYAYLDNIGISGATHISAIGQYAILLFVVFVTLEQLAIGEKYLEAAFQIAFAGFAFAFGLAFGIGGVDAARGFIERALKHQNRDRL